MYVRPHLNILGTRGIPACHGGFETFAERFALYLVSQGISVTVYCQSDCSSDPTLKEDTWKGIRRVHIGTKRSGCVGTMEFDLACVRDVLKRPGVDLVLGYNTAIFNVLQRLKGRRVLMNMDGIEWKRAKWSLPAKIWFFLNEVIGSNISNVAIADHPAIARHVSKRCLKAPVVIPYGADVVSAADEKPVLKLGLKPGQYLISIARPEPENSILEVIKAHGAADTDMDFVILGRMDASNPYHREIKRVAGPNIRFPGAIYDREAVNALRFHARIYVHGHQVGGTNPSLVEALGAGNPVIAHDNRFNRWTAGPGQRYFDSVESCADHIRNLTRDDVAVYAARIAARDQHARKFRWDDVFARYEEVCFDVSRRRAQASVQVAAE